METKSLKYHFVDLYVRSRDGLKVVYKNPEEKRKMGIYKIWFGDKYYLGSANILDRRIRGHKADLMKVFKACDRDYRGYHYNTVVHLVENMKIKEMAVELVEECYCANELIDGEKKWLEIAKTDPTCLNVDYNVRRASDEYIAAKKAGGFKYVIEPLKKTCSAVYRLYYGDKKNIIVKSKDVNSILRSIQIKVNKFVARLIEMPADDIYIHFYAFVNDNPGLDFRVEIILKSDSPYELLKAEQLEIEKSIHDTDVLNSLAEAYIPEFNSDKQSYGWIPTVDILNFKKWLKNRTVE